MIDSFNSPSKSVLERNLQALQKSQPGLHERVHWPVDGDHIWQEEEGRWIYRFHRSQHPLAVEGPALEASLTALDSDSEEAIFLLGVGLGEQLRELLSRDATRRVVAWDRDPWVLRLLLSLEDWSAELGSGCLEFALGSDLLEHAGKYPEERIVRHPLLAGIYEAESILMKMGPGSKRALLCTGGLFVDSLADALRAEGYSVYPFEVQRLAFEELQLTAARTQAELVCGINFVNGLPEFCKALSLPYLVWEIDPSTDSLKPLGAPAPHVHVFTYRKLNVAAYKRAGFEHVSYLPLAADPKRRRPLKLDEAQLSRYAAPVSFVGSSLVENARTYQQAFLELVENFKPNSKAAAQQVLSDLLESQGSDLSQFVIPEQLDQLLPGFQAHCVARGFQNPASLLGEVAASEKRRRWVADLADQRIDVWGDEGWSAPFPEGATYRGPALHETELPVIYNASTINLDVGRLYQDDIVTMRVFDILACEGFILAEHTDDLAELFEIGEEVVSYKDRHDLRAKVTYYLDHPEEARQIARRGRRAILERHTFGARVRSMLASLESVRLASAST